VYRASQRQAALDAQALRRAKVERLLLGAPEPYTNLGGRPGRALVAGTVLGLVVVLVLGVFAVAAGARAAQQAKQRAGQAPATTAPARQAAHGQASGAVTAEPIVATVVAGAGGSCLDDPAAVSVRPAFAAGGRLDRVELSGLTAACVGRTAELALVGAGGERVAVRRFRVGAPGRLVVRDWSDPVVDRSQVDRVTLAV
jgi:hypothetical protein